MKQNLLLFSPARHLLMHCFDRLIRGLRITRWQADKGIFVRLTTSQSNQVPYRLQTALISKDTHVIRVAVMFAAEYPCF
jgi:hypothetical protein